VRKELDPVDRALQSLQGRQWSGDSFNIELEKRLMQAFDAHRPAARMARYRVLVPVLAILVIAGVAFAAAGGVALVKSWFVTTKINGEVVDTREVVPNEDGSAKFSVPVGPPQGDTQVVEMSIEGDGSDAGGMKTVTITSDGNTAEVEIKPEQAKPEE
jgi:hypothetical protein